MEEQFDGDPRSTTTDVTDKQWQEISNNLHIPGIPVYFLLDRKGEMVFSNLTEGGYPGNDVVKKVITQALNQK